MIVTPMRGTDLDAVARLAGQLGYPSSGAEVADRFALLHRSEGNAVLVARDSEYGPPLGWIHVRRHVSLASDPRAEIEGLVVDEARRGRGTGTRLLAEAESWAAAQGLSIVRFTSNVVRKEAHRLYERLGYETTKTSLVFSKRVLR